jgi:hypothetical protein
MTVVTLAMVLDDGLRVTLESIKQQDLKVKHVVIDGSKADIIKQYVNQNYKDVEVINQNPQGIYSGMNFALSRISPTDYVIFLNSSDFLGSTSTLNSINTSLGSSNSWFFWETIGFKGSGGARFLYGKKNFHLKEFSEGTILLPHPSTIIPCNWILSIGGFNKKYKIIADMDLAFRIFKKYGEPKFIENTFSIHELGGISTVNSSKSAFELRKSRFRNFPLVTTRQICKKILLGKVHSNTHNDSNEVEDYRRISHYKSCFRTQEYPQCCRAGLLHSAP